MIEAERATPAGDEADLWDVAVIGAGPAGSMAARECARRGLRVALLDKAAFPRVKVCGCCVSRGALSVLENVGLAHLVRELGGVPLREWHVAAQGRVAALTDLNLGVSLSRSALDAALVSAAVAAGVTFLPNTAALIGDCGERTRSVQVRTGQGPGNLAARVVVAAAGLNARAEDPAHRHGNRLGAAAIADSAPEVLGPGKVYMACAKSGYVGAVRLEDGRLNLAASLAPQLIRELGGLGPAAAAVLEDAGIAIPRCDALGWQGTTYLTYRPRRVADDRLFLVGDAAGYVEPFTGEGIAWALGTGAAVAEFAAQGCNHWDPGLAAKWTRRHSALIGWNQTRCRMVARLLRSGLALSSGVWCVDRAPRLSRRLVRRFGRLTA